MCLVQLKYQYQYKVRQDSCVLVDVNLLASSLISPVRFGQFVLDGARHHVSSAGMLLLS